MTGRKVNPTARAPEHWASTCMLPRQWPSDRPCLEGVAVPEDIAEALAALGLRHVADETSDCVLRFETVLSYKRPNELRVGPEPLENVRDRLAAAGVDLSVDDGAVNAEGADLSTRAELGQIWRERREEWLGAVARIAVIKHGAVDSIGEPSCTCILNGNPWKSLTRCADFVVRRPRFFRGRPIDARATCYQSAAEYERAKREESMAQRFAAERMARGLLDREEGEEDAS